MTTTEEIQAAVYRQLPFWVEILRKDTSLSTDLYERVEEIVGAMEYIGRDEPSDAEIIAHNSAGTAWHDGCR